MSNRLSGIASLGYQGTNAPNPPNLTYQRRDPTPNDWQNVSIGDIWINTTLLKIWMLVSLSGNQAVWQLLRGGSIDSLTSNTGGQVDPDANGNINVLGDGTTITGVGNPGTNTITFSTIGTGVVSTLTGNSGGPVSPLAGNINVVGTGVIDIVGNPGTNTLTVTPSGDIASSFPTDAGTAIPALGALNVVGSGGITTIGTGSTVTVANDGTIATSYATDSGTAIPALGILNVVGSGGLSTIGTGSTVTVTAIFSAFSFVPTLSFGGASTGITYTLQEGYYQALGNLVFYSAGIVLSSKGVATGTARLEGLPFASAGLFQTQMGVMAINGITMAAGQTYCWCLNDIGTTSMLLSSGGSGAPQTLLDDTNFANNTQFTISGFYFRS